jgi:dipeptide/tripeptide permease
LALHEENRIVI